MNDIGYESGNDSISAGRKLPWLQATTSNNVWNDWHVTFRDVVILDGDNKVIAVYNLTSNSLGTSANYAALKQLFLDAAN